MKAVVCKVWGPPESLVVEELPTPVPKAGEVLLDIKAASVNYPDVLMIQKKYQVQPPLPFTPGSEVAGVVSALGEGVTNVKLGDRVIGFVGLGGFAEQVVAPAAGLIPIPPGISDEVAAAFTLVYGTSHHAVLDRGELKAGQTMLVLGAAGGVGLAAVEIGKAIGARVIAAASSAEKLALCEKHGADVLINYETEELREALKRAQLEHGMNSRGVDVVFDPVGGKFAEPAFRSIAWRGRYLVIGFANGQIPALPWNLALLKGASIMGVFWGEFVKREPKANLSGIAEMMTWMREGKIRPHISRVYSLDEAPLALNDLLARKATGKLVIVP